VDLGAEFVRLPVAMNVVGDRESFSLRPATSEDVAQILLIEQKVYPVAPWTEEGLSAELTKPFSKFLLYTDDETDSKIAGYIIYWMLLEDCRILNLAVDLPFRGLGLGQQLIAHAINDAMRQEFPRVSLEVRKSNTPAIQLYQKMKFTISQVRKRFYSNGEDAYEMTLDLNQAAVDF
jgi:ribosomal-protein-alanine N-acetyltransferase